MLSLNRVISIQLQPPYRLGTGLRKDLRDSLDKTNIPKFCFTRIYSERLEYEGAVANDLYQ